MSDTPTPTTPHQRLDARVRGRVQGVFFRASTAEMAQRYGVTGWVRNREDGSVQAAFEGPTTALVEIREWLSTGSPLSRVDEVIADWTTETEGFSDFQILRHYGPSKTSP